MILLVDDDPDKQFLLKRFLNKRFPDNKVTALHNCAEATQLLASPQQKILVTNGRTSERGGIDFDSFARGEHSVPVVMVSLREELKQKALDAGVVAFVETGDDEELSSAVTRAFDRLPRANLSPLEE
jgi:CheY-like chemotaxis protein